MTSAERERVLSVLIPLPRKEVRQMRREKDIVGPEQGITLEDLGVKLPPGVQAHWKDEMRDGLRTIINGWKLQAHGKTLLALPEDEQTKKEQELREQVTPLIEEHDAAHFEESRAERERDDLRIAVDEVWVSRDNPFLNQDRIERERASKELGLKAAKAKFTEALKAVKKTDSKLPSWLQQHQR